MGNDSGGDTGTSCLEHNFFSDFEACPKCLLDVMQFQNNRLKSQLAAEKGHVKQLQDGCDSGRALLREITEELHAEREAHKKTNAEVSLPNDNCLKVCSYLKVQANINSDLRRKIANLNLCLSACGTAALGYDEREDDDNIPGMPGYSEARSRVAGLFKEASKLKDRAEKAEADLKELQGRFDSAPVVQIESLYDVALRYGRVTGIWIDDAPTWHIDLEPGQSIPVKLVPVKGEEE